MRKLSTREVREHLTELEDLIAKEGELLLTRRGRPVARILPVTGARRLPSRARLRSQMPRLSTPSEVLLRKERDER